MQEGFGRSYDQQAHSKQQQINPLYLDFEDIQETFGLSSDEEVGDHLNQHQLKQRQKEQPSHQIHPAFQAIGSMKPSLFYSNSIEEEYQPPKYAPVEKPEKQKKEKKTRRNTHCYQKKIFYESESEEPEQQTSPEKRRKMTMEYQSNNQSLAIFPKTSKIQPEYKQFQQIKVKRLDQEPEEKGARSNEEQLIGQINQQLLFYDEYQDSKEPSDQSHGSGGRKKEEVNSNTLSRSQNEQVIQSFPSIQVIENILDPSQEMIKKQQELTEMLFNLDDCRAKHAFLKSGLEVGSRVVFEALVENNNIFAREYSLWLDGGDKKMLLMQAKKYVKITEDYYLLNQYCDNQAPFKFMAKLESNFMRKQLILLDQPEDVDSQNKQVYGKFAVCSEMEGKPSVVAAFPAFDKLSRQQRVFNIGSNSENFKTLLRYRQNQVTYISSCRLQQSYESHFMARNNLIKTRKTMTLTDSNGVIKVYIGKTESRRYKIFAGSGINPLLIFAIFIVMIES